MSDLWLSTLQTETPQAGFDLAVKLARTGIKVTQPSAEVRSALRAAYDHDTAQLITSSHVIAVHFQTIAAANHHWIKSLP
jgi:Hexameric tyrosine-coordinated heme protein (HTHP)